MAPYIGGPERDRAYGHCLLALTILFIFAADYPQEDVAWPTLMVTAWCYYFKAYTLFLAPQRARFGKKRRGAEVSTSLQDIEDNTFRLFFRFDRDEVRQLLEYLRFPAVVILDNGGQLSGEVVLLMLLYRFHAAQPLLDAQRFFGVHYSLISRAVKWATEHIYSQFRNKLNFDFNLVQARIQLYAMKIEAKSGGAVHNVWGFIDGTVRPTARPVRGQREFYSGHKKAHGLRYQAITLPDGLIAQLWGPLGARWPDITMVQESGLEQLLEENFPGYCLWGDAGYGLSEFIMRPFHRRTATAAQLAWMAVLAPLRATIEWAFGLITRSFPFFSLKAGQKYLLSPVAKHYMVAAALTNCRTCLRGGNSISKFFKLRPPTLEEYCRDLEDPINFVPEEHTVYRGEDSGALVEHQEDSDEEDEEGVAAANLADLLQHL